MTDYRKKITCETENETKLFAEKLASIAQKRDVFALYGTLGAGKSTFSRYFIQYLCGLIDVPSPTFTLLQTYNAKEYDVWHYDMYRLKHAEEAYELGVEDAFFEGVCLVEWPEKIAGLLPRDIWKITITTEGARRHFTIDLSSEEKNKRLEEALFA